MAFKAKPNNETMNQRDFFAELKRRNVIRFAGVSLRDAVDMAGARPRKLLRLPPLTLEVGQPAALVLFDWEEGGDFRVRETIISGAP